MKKHLNSFDFILNTVAAPHNLDAYLELLKRDGAMCLVGCRTIRIHRPASPISFSSAGNWPVRSSAGSRRRRKCSISAPSTTSSRALNIIPMQKLNEAYERMLKSDVKNRFMVDIASLE